MANRGYVDYSAPYFAEKEKGRQQISQEAAYASAMAEKLGQYTPELQAAALQPMGYTPTVGESLIGAPIRGLGKLFGIESMQQVGAPQPFDIGQIQQQAAPTYPPLPEGTPPEMREALEGIAQQMGLTPQQEPTTVPSVPSEVVGKPRLKTNVEREAERRQQEQVWDLIMQTYQTDQERQMAEAQIEQTRQATEQSRAQTAEIQKRTARGLPPTEWSLIKDEMEKTGESFTDIIRKVNAAKANKTAALQIYDAAIAAGHFSGTFEQWTALMNRAKWNPIEAATKMFYANPFAAFSTPIDQHWQVIYQMADNMSKVADKIDQDMLARTGRGLAGKDIPIPDELMAQGITEKDIADDMKATGASRTQAIQMMMNYLKQQNRVRTGPQSAPPVAPARK